MEPRIPNMVWLILVVDAVERFALDKGRMNHTMFGILPSSKANLSIASATTINHTMFGILGSVDAWKTHESVY